jgi:hypothetical protein
MPYFVEGMWNRLLDRKGLLAVMFGPCRIHTEIGGVKVEIHEQTEYPFSDRIRFEFHPEEPVEFTFAMRKPFGVRSLEISGPENAVWKNNGEIISFHRKWKRQDHLEVQFNFEVEDMIQPASKSVKGIGAYLRRGPLVYALPFEHKISSRKERRKSGFYRYRIKAHDKTGWDYKLPAGERFIFFRRNGHQSPDPWTRPPVGLKGELLDKKGHRIPSELVPMGTTVFRRITFPLTYAHQSE